jgi:hypothetical protein
MLALRFWLHHPLAGGARSLAHNVLFTETVEEDLSELRASKYLSARFGQLGWAAAGVYTYLSLQ